MFHYLNYIIKSLHNSFLAFAYTKLAISHWPLVKKLQLINNCKQRNYSCKQFVIYVQEICFIWVCLVQCNHCTFDFLLNLCTSCSLYNRCIIPGTAYHYKVLSVHVIQRYVSVHHSVVRIGLRLSSVLVLDRSIQLHQVFVDSLSQRPLQWWFSEAQVSIGIEQLLLFIGDPDRSLFWNGYITAVHWIAAPIHGGTAKGITVHEITDNSFI